MSTAAAPIRRHLVVSIFLIVTGAVGLYGSFALTLDEIKKASAPSTRLGCDVNPFVSCSDVMASWQGHLLGFPNPLLGLMGFVAPIAVGVMLLSRIAPGRWFWFSFNAGVFLAWVLVTWLFTQTVWFIGALCPWCMLVWSMTIPMFWVLTIWNLSRGNLPFGPRARRIGRALLPYCWVFPLANYVFIALAIILVFPNILTLF